MKQTVVLFPSFGAGHIAPMAHLAKLFLRRGFNVVIAVIASSSVTSADAISRITSGNPGFSVHTLPPVQADETDIMNVIRLSGLLLGDYLVSVSAAALVVDFFCSTALAAASAAGVPGYIYFTCAANTLAAFMLSSGSTPGEDPVRIPHLPAVRAADVPLRFWNPGFRSVISRFSDAKAILVNSFAWLEPNGLKALREGAAPPVHCIGPLIAGGEEEDRHECLAWLDGQPERSVVFLCFGSMGVFPAEQIKEMAVGLERSGQRFLWVVRGASPDGTSRNSFGVVLPPPDLDALLPEGFLERTKSIGMVVKSWAPQAAVLQHKATGAFVTHCGWNSTLEAVAAGVPMVCWPLYAEQRMNKVFIVEDMRLGVEMGGYYEEMVAAEEIERKVRWVMESEEAKELRRRSSEAKERAAEALKDGGPSVAAFDEFIKNAALEPEHTT